MGYKKTVEQKSVKIVQKETTKDDKESNNNTSSGVQFVEKPEMIKMDKKQNRAEIYQAVKRARLRSINLNNDLTISNFSSKDKKEYSKFKPYFNEVTAFTAKNSG